MEEVVELEGMVIPDSYHSEEEREEDLKSKRRPSLFQSLMRRNNMINDDDEEAKEGDLEDKSIVNDDEEEEFYMVWFDAFLAKHGIDKDYLDQSSSVLQQEVLKTWLQKKISSAQFLYKESQIDLSFINFRYVICKRWLSSL